MRTSEATGRFVVWALLGNALALSACGGGAPARAPLTGVVAISAGLTHACAQLDDGTARCWGGNAFGELGDGNTAYAVATPVRVGGGVSGLHAIAAGPSYTCALAPDPQVLCWGNNTFGELGNGSAVVGLPGDLAGELYTTSPVAVPGVVGSAATLIVGAELDELSGYTCALKIDGTAQCWGKNELGLGPTPITSANAPVALPVTGIAQLALGGSYACVLLHDATVVCWGLGPLGQAGITGSMVPISVTGLPAATALATGDLHACALIFDGTVQCWGIAVVAAPPGESTKDSDTPVAIAGVSGVSAIAAAGSRTCVLLTGGTVQCWGDATPLIAVPVRGITRATAIAMGARLTCALIVDGTVQCWGDDSQGQVGNGVTPTGKTTVVTPTEVVSGG